MATINDYFADFFLDHALRGEGTWPDPLYFCLCTSAPTVTDTGADIVTKETTYSGYQRVAVSVDDLTFGAGAAGDVTNSVAAITFPVVGLSVGSAITHWAICDAVTDGNCLFFGTIDVGSVTPDTGDTLSFETSDFTLSGL
jgi:hypothetical protein